uniref:Uncharacterized protein n=1 Tax=Arundo donax TaxID=35708 RepID=A0A0A8ZBV3_ARUDO
MIFWTIVTTNIELYLYL